MACEYFSVNGNAHSELATYLNDKINNGNDELTRDQMIYFRSKEFIDLFGDYITAYTQEFAGEYDEMLDRINDVGEPLLQYDEDVQQHYFLNKDHQKVYFPITKKELRSILTYDEINKVASRLALTYFKKSKIDFNNIDFESGDKLPDLNTFVKSEINNKIKSLEEAEDLNSLISLEVVKELPNYVEELTSEVEGFFKRMSLKTVADDNVLNLEDVEENTKDAGFGLNSFERDSKDSVSTNVKLRLSLLEDKQNIDPVWNEPTFMKFDEVYSTLATILTDVVDLPGEDIWDIYKENISRIINKKPYLQDIYDYITDKSFNSDKQNEFVQAFRLHKNNHQISQQTIEVVNTENEESKTVINYNTLGISDSGNKTTMVIENWYDNFKTNFLNKDNTLQDKAVEKLTLLDKGFKELNARYNTLKTNYNINEEEKIVNNYIKGLKELGINLSKEAFENYLDNFNQDISEKAHINKISEALYRTSLGVDSILKSLTGLNKSTPLYENVFQKASYIFKTFAQNEAFFIPEGSDATIISGGKQKWIYSYPSYLSTLIRQWKKDPGLLVDLLNSSEYQKGSFLLKYLTGTIDENGVENDLDVNERLTLSKQRLDNFDLGIFNQMQVNDEFASTTELSFKDYVTDHVNKILLNDYKRTITQADKTTEYQIKTGLNLNAFDGIENIEGKNKILISDPVKKMFFNYFASEYNRMIEAANEVVNDENLTIHYHYKKGTNPKSMTGNAFKSQYFEKLSPGTKGLNEIEKALHELLYVNDKPLLESLVYGQDSELTHLLEIYIEKELLKGVEKTFQNLIQAEIIQINNEGNAVLNNLDQSILDKYSKFNKKSDNFAASAIATDYYVNSVHTAIEYTKMFTGDMAYFKDPVDFKKRIPATYTDGLQLRIQPGQELFKIATIESVTRQSPFYDKLVEYLGINGANPYKNINSADAQAWITPQRWKFLVEGLGKWSKAHNEVYKKMMSDEPIEYTEKELKIAAQPLKGVYFYREPSGKPVYLKYSQAVLSQALVKGSDLENLYNKMRDSKIDEVITLDGVKVGAVTPTKIHDNDGNMLKDFNLVSQTLYNRGWKLQQDLPTKTYKDTDLGSQIQKNIFAGIIHRLEDNNFELDNQLVTGQTILDEIVKTIRNLNEKGLNDIKKEFQLNDKYEIKKVKGFYKSLIKELESRNGSQNIIDALKAELALPGIPQAGSKLINIFASIMTDRLIKLKTNGGSFIQMSNFGLNKFEGNNQGIVWSPDADSTTNEPYTYVGEDGRVKVKPGGVLVSSSFISKYIPNWREYKPEQLFNEIIDKDIQENIIGYRIPNQGLASNDALRIVGILPESAGDSIVAYTGITTKTGSDFDVDKMYIMFPKFKKVNNKLVYDNEDDGNKLIKLYKSVLTHPEVIKDVMKPIDIDFINNEINSLFDKESNETLHHFDPFEDIKLRYLFLGGKAGVGMEANAMVDISRTGELSLNNLYIDWGHINEYGETVFDKEFSVSLSKKDMDYYIKIMNPENIEKFKNELTKVKIGDSLTAILNGFVDIAKDPVLPKGNWVTATTNVGNLMLRAGVHPLYVINFMAQPIIKDYVDFQKNIEGLTSNNSGDTIFKFKQEIVLNALNDIDPKYKTAYQRFFKKINADYKLDRLQEALDAGMQKSTYDKEIAKIEKLRKEAFKSIGKDFGDENVDKIVKIFNDEHNKVFNPNFVDLQKESLQNFREQITNIRDNSFQLTVLNKFKELQDISKKLGENVIVSKTDTNGMGKNINSLYSLINLKQHILDKQNNFGALKGFESKFVNSPLEVYYNSMLEVVKIVDANPTLFPQGQLQVQDMFNEISNDLYNKPAIDSELMDNLEVSYNSYLMSNFFNLTKEQSDDLLNDLPNRFKVFKAQNKGKYFMLEELNIKEPKKKGDLSIIGLNNRKKSLTYEKEFTDSWKDLYLDNPKLAEDLINYSFLTSGFKMNSTQFFTYIPYNHFIKKNMNQFVKSFKDQQQADFIDLFYRNNLDNKKYVRKLLPSKVNIAGLTDSKNNLLPVKLGFQLEGVNNTNYYVSYENNYYKLEGYTPSKIDGNIVGYRPIYLAIKPASIKINGKNIFNYSSYNNNDLYVANDEDVKAAKAYVIEERNKNVFDNINMEKEVVQKILNNNAQLALFENNDEQITFSKNLWNENEKDILNKFPDLTSEQFIQMTEEEQQKLINCL